MMPAAEGVVEEAIIGVAITAAAIFKVVEEGVSIEGGEQEEEEVLKILEMQGDSKDMAAIMMLIQRLKEEDLDVGGFKRHGSNNDVNSEAKRGGFGRGGGRGDGRGRGNRGTQNFQRGGNRAPLVPY